MFTLSGHSRYNDLYVTTQTFSIPLYIVAVELLDSAVNLTCGVAGECIKQTCSYTSTADEPPIALCYIDEKKSIKFEYLHSYSPKRLFKAFNHYKKHFLTQTDDDPFK